ncbi:uncharacterized protein N7483_002414 [Penicillium malachiteum]|uniref:uncharacterized protein n=1 Tax=Penicillium malachiteum TaxID=1324776 RepID=UPI002548779B|nr:uncharacterized protein N7483_002414 [Penicillium malachiteum]KAJ5737289.1 hypothetical protein N7483_002414 [Penicillium malachiteum]
MNICISTTPWAYWDTASSGVAQMPFVRTHVPHSRSTFRRYWTLRRQSLGGLLPSLDQKGISGYRGLVQAGIGLYIAGFTTTMLAVALGGLESEIFSRQNRLSSLLITAATISVSVRYGLLAFGIKRILGEVGIRASLGGQMFAVAWLAVLFSFVASLIWVILLF